MIKQDKVFKTHVQQLKILKSRGLDIFPIYYNLNIIKRSNYYNLINGYSDLFLSIKNSGVYIKGSSLKEIYELYTFDKRLRSLYLNEILRIEELVKSSIAYNFSMSFGYKDYDYLHRNNFTSYTDGIKNTDVNYLISKLTNNIWKSKNVQPYIKHYREEHNYVPLWVLVNSMTFGETSKFYSHMKHRERKLVSDTFNHNYPISPKNFDNYLKTLGVFRNILAHDERFYNFKKKNRYGKPYVINFDGYLNLTKMDSSVASLTFIIKLLLSPNDFNTFENKLTKEFENLSEKLVTIDIDAVLNQMGFISASSNINDLSDVVSKLNT